MLYFQQGMNHSSEKLVSRESILVVEKKSMHSGSVRDDGSDSQHLAKVFRDFYVIHPGFGG